VEHDEELISIANLIIDLGPKAGIEGGEIVFSGTLKNIKTNPKSLTGQYLGNSLSYPTKNPMEKRKINKKKTIQMRGISTNNLKDVSLDIPLGVMVGIAGVSGSGKSSLISDTLVPLLQQQFKYLRKKKAKSVKTNENNEIEEDTTDPFEIIKGKIEGWNLVDNIAIVTQSPIGRNRNSTPASYTGLWDYIRKLFAKLPLAKKRKYKDGHFSFNSDKGRCPSCKGEGRISLSISFLDQISVICEECNGQRYLPEILDVKYHGKNIREILDLSVKEGLLIFADEPKIVKFLSILDQIGMGYITLGQSATTLSGGEAQRVKLAKTLANSKNSNALFILDEPTTGLHFHDEVKLLHLLDQLVDQGNSVVIIEHNPKILSYCDWIIELGPQGGPEGGEIVSMGKPSDLKSNTQSIIGPFLNS
jgi:excinuclease ABC A subunit